MFDLGWSEILIISVVTIIVVGPRELPGLLRNVGRMMSQVRRMASEFNRQIDSAVREAELDDVRKTVSDVTSNNPIKEFENTIKSAMPTGGVVGRAVAASGGASPASSLLKTTDGPKVQEGEAEFIGPARQTSAGNGASPAATANPAAVNGKGAESGIDAPAAVEPTSGDKGRLMERADESWQAAQTSDEPSDHHKGDA